MTSAHVSAPLLPAEELAARRVEPDFLLLPQAERCFAERAMRLRQLAAQHPMRGFLLFAAELAQAQQAALETLPAVPLPDAAALAAATQGGKPPLPAALWPRDGAWHAVARALAQAVQPHAPQPAGIARVAEAQADWLEAQAALIVRGVAGEDEPAGESDTRGDSGTPLDLSAAPVLAAALQVYWTALVARTAQAHPTAFGRVADATHCPCCGSLPTASVVRVTADRGGLRYLHCALCGSEWHVVRVKCAHCEGTGGIAYESLLPAGMEADEATATRAVVQAETCSHCHHYLKIIHADRDAMADAVADDVASLPLDVLTSETGMQRHGVNLLLFYGEVQG